MSSKIPAKTLSASSAAAWMERLRAKASSYRSAADLSRATRTTLLDRRTAPDAADRLVLRTSLDQLASAVPARDAASLADRLEAISKQVAERWAKRGVALNFMAAPVHGCYYLSTDCFYVEINIEGASGRIVEAKVHHIDSNHPNQQASSPKNCPEIISCLTKGDFNKFIDHLEGLMSIYDMPNASAHDKTRGWHSLSVLEADLIRIENLSRYHEKAEDLSRMINHSPLGFVQARAGGLPLKLTYFISPQDKIDMSTKSFRILNASTINENNLGVYATIGIERSEQPRALPLQPLISTEGKEIPMTNSNTVLLPASFVLHLNTDLPLEVSKYEEIKRITGIPFIDTKQVKTAPLLQLITKSTSDESLDSSNNRGLFVTLPDQSHCYFLSDHDSLNGYVVKKIPFSHPAQVPRILAILRKQAVFNAILSSCIRTSGIQDLEKSILFEVSCMDIEHLCVTFEMSQDRGMASFELDFTDLRNVQSKMHKMSSSTSDALMDVNQGYLVAKAVFDRSLSLPLTMRALTHQLMKRPKREPEPDLDYPPYPHYNNGNLENGNGGVQSMDLDFHSQPPTLKVEPMDYDGGGGGVGNSTNNGSRDHLNANRPQDAASIPGARSKITPNTTAIQPPAPPVPSIKVTKTAEPNRQDRTDSHKTDRYSTKSDSKSVYKSSSNSNHLEIKAFKAKPASSGSGGTTSSSSSTSSSSKSQSSSVVSKSSSKMGSDIKPSVSITPVSSADAATLNMKKPAGIEIIPLGDKLPENETGNSNRKTEKSSSSSSSSDSKSSSLLKEIKRSLSEDDKRRMEKKEGKKRKRDHFVLENKSPSSSSSNSNSKKSKSGQYSSSSSSSGSGGSSSSSSSSSKKLTSVIDRLSSSGHNDSGIEIIPRNDKKSPQQQQGLKLTIKSTSSSSSSSSSSKHRSSSSDYHHKSSSSSSSSKHSSSSSKHSSSSSSSSAKRSSPSISQMMGSSSSGSKHSKSPSSSLLKSSSSSSSSSSSKADRQRHADKERMEQVERLLEGNKLDTTTFQIPKRTKPDSGSTNPPPGSIGSDSKSGNPSSKSANASPKYNTSPSPKYGVSPKHTGGSQHSTTHDKSKKDGGGGTSPPPILSPSTNPSTGSSLKSGGQNPTSASLSFMSLPRNAPSPPHLAAFDKAAGCDKDINIGINNSK